jgi:predicted component of type VI protein secretion system
MTHRFLQIMTRNEPVFTKLKHAKQFSIKNFYTELRGYPKNGLVIDKQTDREKDRQTN